MSYNIDEPLSDDEVYFGKITLKELKRHILWDKQPKTACATSVANSPKKNEEQNTSLKILQTHSQPNLISGGENSYLDSSGLISSQWDIKDADDSFIKMESMVAKLCVAPISNEKTEELNNTLEVIEYILNNPPCSVTTDRLGEVNDKRLENENPVINTESDVLYASPQKNYSRVKKNDANCLPKPLKSTPVKTVNKPHKHAESCNTPVDLKHKPIFKTPSQPLSLKKPSAMSSKKTPSRSNAYQHIGSPVASYINNCPIVPLVKDVHPKKPLPGPSSIPKFVKNPPSTKPSNKENVNLPSIAYKSAKKTKVIDLPDEQKLPQCQWAKKIMTSLPRPMVMKHDHRELNLAKKKLLSQQEDSFADLSYRQAEVSVCTQKSAFKSNKNF